MRIRPRDFEDRHSASESILFPKDPACQPASGHRSFDLTGLPESASQVFESIEVLSRRIEDLARELNCLGHFDDDGRGPRAASERERDFCPASRWSSSRSH